MALSLVTAPAVEPISVADAKLHLRVDVSDEDTLIAGLIVAAREYVEAFTHRALITQTWDYALDSFPCWRDEVIELPMPPVSAVTSVTYTAMDGTATVWSSANYTTDLPAGPTARVGRLFPNYSTYYPVTRWVPNAVTVRFVCGYGATAASVPSSLIAGMKLVLGNWYANREAGQIVRGSADVLPFGVDALLWPFKAF